VSRAATTAGEAIPVRDCHEILAFISGVPRENADAYLPPGYTAIDPESPQRDAEVVLRAAECDVTVGGATRRTRFAEARITVEPPEASEGALLDWYLLSWATDNRALRRWARTGTGADGVVRYSDRIEYGFDPEPFLVVDAPEPAAWAYTIDALAPRGTGAPGIPITINLWRDTGVGSVRFRRAADAVQVVPTQGRVGTPCGSELAALLALTAECAEGSTVSVDASRTVFFANTVATETQTKEVFGR
jgi:hypothetical protein